MRDAVETVDAPEATALGAAMIGAVGAGVFKDLAEASEHMVHLKKRFEPTAAAMAQYDDVFSVFESCYEGLAKEAFPKVFQYQQKYH